MMLITRIAISSRLLSLLVILNIVDSWADDGFDHYLDGRYRYEIVDQDGFGNRAEASTLRTNLGLTWPLRAESDASLLLEVQNVSAIGSERYFSTTNGNTEYPVVVDPVGTELNQLALTLKVCEDSKITLGRQKVHLDNQRFIGSVDWRQNDQTFDGLFLTAKIGEKDEFIYGYVNNVNRIFGDDHPLGDLDSNSHLLNWGHRIAADIKLNVYGYLLDIENLSSFSSATFGARISGQHDLSSGNKLHYHIELARQSDYADNLESFSLLYWGSEFGMQYGYLGWAIGREILEGNGNRGFSTPLATLHKYNGWADIFLTTPQDGLEDYYFQLMAPNIFGFKTMLVYHHFSAENDSAFYGTTYGREKDFVLSKKINAHFDFSVKYADYSEETYALNTDKLWFVMDVKY